MGVSKDCWEYKDENNSDSVCIYLSEFTRTYPLGFHLDLGEASDLKPRGGGALLRPGWAHGPMTGLSAGGLLVASCQKQGEGRVSCTDTPNYNHGQIVLENAKIMKS